VITATHKKQWPLPLSLSGVTVRFEAGETSVLEMRHGRRQDTYRSSGAVLQIDTREVMEAPKDAEF